MVISWRICFIGVSFLFFGLPANAITADLTKELNLSEQQAVQSGKLVTHTRTIGDGYVREVDAFQYINAPAQEILALISDFEQMPEFMPNLDKIEVLEENKKETLANYTLSLPFGITKRYRLKIWYDREPAELSMSWESVDWPGLQEDETIKYTSGIWLLKPLNAEQTLLVYHTKTDPGYVPTGLGWVVGYLTEQAIIDLIESTKDRVEIQWKNKQNIQ